MSKKDLSKLRCGGKVLIVVPTTELKKQWTKIIKRNENYSKLFIEIKVINTVSLTDGFTRDVDLLIIDEVHMMAADKFKRVFSRVRYSWILGLTATVKRLDGKEYIIQQYAPICDTISQKDAIKNGWISDFIEFNLAVPITRAEAEAQTQMGKSIRFYMSKFGDFNKMLSNMHAGNASNYVRLYNQSRYPHEHITVQDVMKWAIQGMRLIAKRKEFLDTTQHKIEAAVELIEEFNVRTITFSQAVAFADELVKRLDNCKPYHSSIESERRVVHKEKKYKTLNGAQKFLKAQQELGYDAKLSKKGELHIVKWKTTKAVSGSKIAEENVDAFVKGKLQILASAKALDQGFDVEDVVLGVDGSRSEAPTQHTQRTGRVARSYKLSNGLEATKIYVNLYIPDWSVPNSRDEQKLRACQVNNADNVVWVDDLDELKKMLRLILKKRESVIKSADSNANC